MQPAAQELFVHPVHRSDLLFQHSAPPLPDLALATLDGAPATLNVHAGRPVVLNLWATCGRPGARPAGAKCRYWRTPSCVVPTSPSSWSTRASSTLLAAAW